MQKRIVWVGTGAMTTDVGGCSTKQTSTLALALANSHSFFLDEILIYVGFGFFFCNFYLYMGKWFNLTTSFPLD